MNTRIAAVFAAVLSLALAAGCAPASKKQAYAPAAQKPKRMIKEKWHELNLTGDWNMDLQILRVLSDIWHGMGDIGEILDTASRIRGTSELSWYREWYATAERVSGMANAGLAAGHKTSAGEAFLRAANYYRASEFYLHADPKDTRIQEASRKGVDCYGKAMELLDLPVTRVAIPYENTTLPGWFYKSPKAKGRAPTLLVIQGYDGTAEETQYAGLEAMKRGINCLIFEGPGQGQALRGQGLKFRLDWEKVFTPVIDWVSARPDVDSKRIAVLGISFGGSFVVRAAAFEHRPKIYIANPGYLDIADVFFERLDKKLVNLYREDPAGFNDKMEDAMKYTVVYRWFLNDGMWKFGADTPAGLVDMLMAYDNAPYVGKITSTMLVMDGEEEIAGKGQAKALYDALKCPKDYMLFTAEETASLHCQNGALSVGTARMFDWLEERL
jgi:alpha-beta hydrolase superfamily lysophospholipase